MFKKFENLILGVDNIVHYEMSQTKFLYHFIIEK